MPGTSPTIYRASLPTDAPATFTGLFGAGKRLTRARYPNCDDITGPSCYTLNASGPTAARVRSPTHDLFDDPGAENLEVKNLNGVDMFGDASSDDAPAHGPHGASDGTLPAGRNLSLVVEHPDYAWRCHEDCGWQAYSKWRGVVCEQPDACRMDPVHNEPYWDQQVSAGFHWNATTKHSGTWHSGPEPCLYDGGVHMCLCVISVFVISVRAHMCLCVFWAVSLCVVAG